MSERIHDDEPDTSEPVVRELLRAECPQWADRALAPLQTSGTDNAMWRVALPGEPDVVIRLPRRAGAAAGVERELVVLRQLEAVDLRRGVTTPLVRHAGEPHDVFRHRWSALQWVDGVDGWTGRDHPAIATDAFALDLAAVVRSIGRAESIDGKPREPGRRGGPLLPLLESLDRWLTEPTWNAELSIDTRAVRRLADRAREVADEPIVEGFVHGDLIPGNLLLDDDRLSAVIDWGGAGVGDLAQDLAPAWAVLDRRGRDIFRDALDVGEATWIRGRVTELEHAVGGALYYVPKRHPLGDVMSRTLHRVLADT